MARIEIDFENDEMLKVLYYNAQALVEHATKEFWLYVFNKLVFPERNYVTSTEQPPVEYGTRRRVDIVIKKLQERQLRVLMWKEDKEARASLQDIAEVETQGFTAGFDHLDRGERDREAVWVMTGYGTRSKLWAYSRAEQNFLMPIWPHQGGYGERSNYLDLRGNERVFEWMFEFIKNNPFPTSDFITQCSEREVNKFLVDASCDIFVKVIAIRHGYVKCEIPDGTTIRLGTTWYTSYVIAEDNRRYSCYHIIHESNLYWAYDLNPASH